MALLPPVNSLPTNPYHIARAYSAGEPRRVAAISPASPAARVRLEAAEAGATGRPGAIARLVAAVVPGKVDFSGDSPRPAASALPFYSHPADRNAAAVTMNLGRAVDLSA